MTTGAANIRAADEDAIADAAALIRGGQLVAFPTETVYGLGADATNDGAVAGIFAAKGRPRFNPLIVHYAAAEGLAADTEADPRAARLAAEFWPGPLTIVLRRHESTRLSLLVSAGLDTVAVRVPGNDIARTLIAAAETPIAAPSANRSGDISPTTAAHVARSLGARPAMILDGGPTTVGIESTVVDLTCGQPALLRPGAVTADSIEACIGPIAKAADEAKGAPRRSPGRLDRHYAPRHPLRINATAPRPGEALLAFGPQVPPGGAVTRNLSPGGDLVEAAAKLFAMLHELDSMAIEGIAVMPIPEAGLGAAINDRLVRASHPLPAGDGED